VLTVRPLTMLRTPVTALALAALACLAAACGQAGQPAAGHSGSASAVRSPGARVGRIPAPAHIVVVIMENHSYQDIIGSSGAPYINRLARQGALFTRSYAVTHPSQPNYLDLFSGSDHGITDDSCPNTLSAPNLATGLIAAHRTFAGYSEGLPVTGSVVCAVGEYARKHVPWANFTNVPRSVSRQFSAFGAGGYQHLPTVSFVIPDLCHDMHDCPVAVGDTWLRQHISGYVRWAMTHASVLILTWDEGSSDNHIVTLFAGQQVRPGRYGQPLTHFGVLRTIEDVYRLHHDGAAATATPVTDVWK
jgi:hypothetical protein